MSRRDTPESLNLFLGATLIRLGAKDTPASRETQRERHVFERNLRLER
jgi:hypothetical protein